MDRVNKAIELREKALQPLAELAELGMISKETSGNIYDEVGKNIVNFVSKLVTGGLSVERESTRGTNKSAQDSKISPEVKQPTAASTVETSAAVVLDSPAVNQSAQNVSSQLVLKSPDVSVRAGDIKQRPATNNAATPKRPDVLSTALRHENERREYDRYRQGLSNVRRLTYPDAPASVDYTHTYENAIEPSFMATPPGHEKKKNVVEDLDDDTVKYDKFGDRISPTHKKENVIAEMEDDDTAQKYDKHGEPIINMGRATYRVIVDENHPDALICPFWLESETSDSNENYCSYTGDHEPYYHKYLPDKPVEPLECQFWREGHCCRGSRCPFSHFRTRHGIVKDMNGNATEKFTFTIKGDTTHAGEPGLSSSRYASQSRAQAPAKAFEKSKHTRDLSSAQKSKLDDGTASFRAQLEGSKQVAGRNPNGAPRSTINPTYGSIPRKPYY